MIEEINHVSIIVNGGFTAWSAYSACSKTCGGGKKVTTRTCTKPKPMHGGKTCDGLYTYEKTCNTHSCPGTSNLLLINIF